MLDFISENDLSAIWITLKLASVSTVALLIFGLPFAWWLARTPTRLKPIIEAAVALPLVLPPTVIGFYLLLAFAPNNTIAQLWQTLTGSNLAFSFSGLVIGSFLYSLPFVIQPLQNSFEKISQLTLLTAESLGAKPFDIFLSIVLPSSTRAIMAAATLAFSHTVGEFGIVLMIGGNIQGETQVLSIALFDHVEALDYSSAHQLAIILLTFSFCSLLGIYAIGRKHSEGIIRVAS